MQKVSARERVVHVRTLFSRCQEKVSLEFFVEDLPRSPGLGQAVYPLTIIPGVPLPHPRRIPACGLEMHLGGRDGHAQPDTY